MPFAKGKSGNPSGRPKAQRREVIDAMIAELNVKDPDQLTKNARRLAATAVREAIAGDVQWAKLLMEYVYGKPVQPVEIDIRREAERIAAERGLDPDRIISLAHELRKRQAV